MNPVLKRVLMIIGALLLLVYVGAQAYLIVSSPLTTETVMRTVAYETLETTGVVYRDETVINEQPKGYLFYTVDNGGRVSRQGAIAQVFASETDALRQQELDQLDASIESLSSINAQGTANRANLSTINQQIDETWLAVAQAARGTAVTGMEDLHNRLLTLLNKQQITIGRVSNFDDRLAQLQAERQALAKSFQKSTGTVAAPVAGYFISHLDGYEGVLTTDKLKSLSAQDIRDALAYQPAENRTGIGKVVGDYEWYLACELPAGQVGGLKAGAQLEVCMPLVQSEAIPMQVVAVNTGADGNAALLLQCTRMDQVLSTIRVEKVEIRLRRYEGIRIPDKAIYFNDQQEPGAYVQVGNSLAFRRIQVLYHDATDGFTVCAITEETGYVKLYDKLVTKGENLHDGKLVR